MTTSDLIIIGAGPGGYRAAEYAAKNGLNVIVFENSHVGGTCLNEGCIPTKSFARNAEIVQTLKEADVYGLNGDGYTLDFKKVVERKNQVLESLRSGIETLLSQPGITLVRDCAKFVDAHTVTDSKGETYTAQNIIVATGSVSKMLRLEEWDPEAACDSAFLLHNDVLPRSLCIVGAGVIGMEFASIFNSFGVEVTVVEFLKECLPALDSDIAKRLRKVLEKRGVTFYMQSAVKAITKEGVTFERKGKRQTIVADEVLLAVGRAPRVSDDFANAGFEYDNRRGIVVNDDMQTSVAGIYAIGDVNGRQMLAHAAEMQGIHAVNCILGRHDNIRLDVMPAAIFTHPEAGCVGLTEDQCKERGMEYTCHKSFYRANGKALAMNESEGMLKLMADAEGHIIGCHVFGAHAADLAQEASVLMCKNTTLHELSQMVHIHPTLSEILLAAAE
jgi:dihydrolipoamide dehydrogenase